LTHVFFRKFLALLVIAGLLSLRLSTLTEQVFVEPVEDAIFDVPFIAAEEIPGEGKPVKVKPKRAFDFVLAVADELTLPGETLPLQANSVVVVLNLKDIHTDIFIPPETVS